MEGRAAVLWGLGEDWQVEEVELDDPEPDEALVKMVAAGLCHSDEHIRTGDIPIALPAVGGHEGSGIVEKVGSRVTSLVPGDHVVMSFIPSCGRCRWCASGHQTLCDLGRYLMLGSIANGVPRMRAKGQPVSPMSLVGCFATHQVMNEASLVKIEPDLPLDKAALVSCGVTTGWGSAVHSANVRPGDVVVVVGIGGIGSNAVQGARMAGARWIVAVDPLESKREAGKRFGATHAAEDVFQAFALVNDLTSGQLADSAILTTDVARGDLLGPTMALVRKGGAVVVTAIGPFSQSEVNLSLFELTLWHKEVRGSLFGGGNPRVDIPQLLSFYKDGTLQLDELITKAYALEEVNEGYQDMRDGKNLRGVIVFD
ncbi:MAG: NDMA-dependent alcohol dehydrogenase [Actinomycetota bacterium]|nr:NDMA-dependent alcohol dehydrogenase [Actinomycetota bacterium]